MLPYTSIFSWSYRNPTNSTLSTGRTYFPFIVGTVGAHLFYRFSYLAQQIGNNSPSIPNSVISQTRVGLGLIAIQRSDVESVKEQYSFLESQRGRLPP